MAKNAAARLLTSLVHSPRTNSGPMGGSTNTEGSAMAKAAQKVVAAKVPKAVTGGEVTKTVKIPLMITMTGSKAALASDGDKLVARLRENLPFTLRLGRGRKETISIDAK